MHAKQTKHALLGKSGIGANEIFVMGWCVGGWFRGERDEMDGLRLKLGMNSFYHHCRLFLCWLGLLVCFWGTGWDVESESSYT